MPRCRCSKPWTMAGGPSTWPLRDRDGRARIGRTVLDMQATSALAPLDPEPVLASAHSARSTTAGSPRRVWSPTATPATLHGLEPRRRRRLPRRRRPRGRTAAPSRNLRGAAAPESLGHRILAYRLAIRDCENRQWRIWYVSATEWRPAPSGPHYNIRHAESVDGTLWMRDTTPRRTTHVPRRGHGWLMTTADAHVVRRARHRLRDGDGGADAAGTAAATALRAAGTDWESEMVEYRRSSVRRPAVHALQRERLRCERRGTGATRPLAGGQIGRWLHGRDGEAGASHPRRGSWRGGRVVRVHVRGTARARPIERVEERHELGSPERLRRHTLAPLTSARPSSSPDPRTRRSPVPPPRLHRLRDPGS